MDLNNLIFRRKIIGAIINIERKKRKIRLEDFSSTLQLSKQFLSEIENGYKNINLTTINRIFKEMDIEFNWKTDENNDLLLFNDYIHNYVGIDQKKRKEQSQSIINNEEWRYSFYYPIVLLTEFSSLVLEDSKGNIEEVMEKCEKILSLFDNKQQAIYYYFKGLHEHVDNNNFILGEKYYQKSIQCDPFGEICGMAYYQLTTLYYNQLNLLKSYEVQKKSKRLLEKYNNYRRVVWVEVSLGHIYASSFLFDLMEEQYKKAISLCHFLGEQSYKEKIQYNLVQGLKISRQYEKAIHYGVIYLNSNYRTGDFHAILAWCHYQLHQLKDCKYYLSLIKRNEEVMSEDSKIYVDGLMYLLKGNYQSYYNKLVKYYNKTKDNSKKLNAVIVLEHIIDYCEKNEMYEEGFKYQKELIRLTKFQ